MPSCMLGTSFCCKLAMLAQADRRKGGLLCLAAAAVGLEEQHNALLAKIVPPVLDSFTDQDGRVRYYACEVAATLRSKHALQQPMAEDTHGALFVCHNGNVDARCLCPAAPRSSMVSAISERCLAARRRCTTLQKPAAKRFWRSSPRSSMRCSAYVRTPSPTSKTPPPSLIPSSRSVRQLQSLRLVYARVIIHGVTAHRLQENNDETKLSAQDLVTASPNFDIGAFVPRLKESLTVINPFKRQFLISWITVLDRFAHHDCALVNLAMDGPPDG